VSEANRLGIPVVAVVDTNCDPDDIQYVIPGNDDAIRSGALLTRIIADAVAEGYGQRAARSADDVVAEQAAAAAAAAQAPAPVVTEPEAEPLAEWEIALQQEEAARHAAQAGVAEGQAAPAAAPDQGEPAPAADAPDQGEAAPAGVPDQGEPAPAADAPEEQEPTEGVPEGGLPDQGPPAGA